MYACMYVCVYVCLSACLPGCLSACLPVCLSACLAVCLSVCMSVCMCVNVCMSVCMDGCLRMSARVCFPFTLRGRFRPRSGVNIYTSLHHTEIGLFCLSRSQNVFTSLDTTPLHPLRSAAVWAPSCDMCAPVHRLSRALHCTW